MDWMLPGVDPSETNDRTVQVPFVAVITFKGDKLQSERIYWDQATVLKQLGLIKLDFVPGKAEATKAADQSAVPSNGLMDRHD
ncbi:hypothetical protein JKP88DRAFT_27785 [Tribonema minus]|uniref:Uncharacterized protein n=1 Tax=Tribonema minus TaxID=303371 RepID=A0A835Z796_9STRA|nr:hypothetical protein JKP88DRAFT_27785 [Tribonema minus]